MRNLKKILALVLALMMTLSLMVTASAAKYEDTADSNYGLAIDLVSGIGVINGTGAGKFNPEGTLKRDQAAKIIAYLALTPEVADILPKDSSFKDVGNYWATASIAWAYSNGIVAGTGNGNYSPNREVKGYEFAKMLLTAIGYKAESEGLNGAGWSVNVATLAKKAGIFNGIPKSVDLNKPLARGVAAQMAFNALVANKVEYTGGTTITVNGVTMTSGAVRNFTDTYLAEEYGLDVVPDSGKPCTTLKATKTGIVVANQATGETTTNIAELGFDTTTGKINALSAVAADTKFDYKTGLDMIGHVVEVYADANGNVIAIVDVTTKTVDIAAAIAAGAGSTAKVQAAFGKTATAAAKSCSLDDAYAATINAGVLSGFAVGTGIDGKAAAGTYVMYGTEVVCYIEPLTYTLEQVTNISTTAGAESITLKTAGPLSNKATADVVNEYKGIAKDDYVVYTKTGTIYNLTKATTITGTPSKYDTTSHALTIGGVTYALNNNNGSGLTSDAVVFNAEQTVYLDGQGGYFVVKTKGDSTSTKSGDVFLTAAYTIAGTPDEFGVATPTYWAQCVDMAGNQVIYQVTSDEYDTIKTEASDWKYLYSVETSYDSALKATVADFTKYDYTTVGSEEALKDTSGTIATTDVKIGTDPYYFAKDVKFIFVDGNKSDLKITMKSGAQTVDGSAKPFHFVLGEKDTNNNYTIKYVVVEGEYTGSAAGGTGVMYCTAATSTKQVKGGYEFEVYIDGKKMTVVNVDNSAVAGFANYTVTDGIYNIDTALTTGVHAATAITNLYDNMVTTGDVDDASIANATVVNLTTASISSVKDLIVGDTVALVMGSNNTVVTIYVTAAASRT